MRTLSITTTPDGRFAAHSVDADGHVQPAFTTTDPRHLGRMVEAWATHRNSIPAVMFAEAAQALRAAGRSYLNSRADQEGIATPSKWPAAALRHRPGDAA